MRKVAALKSGNYSEVKYVLFPGIAAAIGKIMQRTENGKTRETRDKTNCCISSPRPEPYSTFDFKMQFSIFQRA